MNFEQYIRNIPNFPKKGIQFKDITPLLANPKAFSFSIDAMCELYADKSYDAIAAFDARGFLFGSAMAYKQQKPLIPLRKTGKLPYQTVSQQYGLEYGKDCVEIHSDAVQAGDKVLMIDDLLATGGTMKAGCSLIEKLGGEVVGCGFVIELNDLRGREKIGEYNIRSLIKYGSYK